jgi:hypothetical protein
MNEKCRPYFHSFYIFITAQTHSLISKIPFSFDFV